MIQYKYVFAMKWISVSFWLLEIYLFVETDLVAVFQNIIFSIQTLIEKQICITLLIHSQIKRQKLSYKPCQIVLYSIHSCLVWQYGLWSFQAGGTKLERFLHKNQHTQRKLLNFEFWINGELSKIGHHFSNKVI